MARKSPGFTLLELMVVVAMLGVLLTIAVQEYGLYVAKSKRTQAIAFLYAAQAAQRTYFARHDAYATSFGAMGLENEFGGTLVNGQTMVTSVYTYALSATATTWCVTATGDIDGDAFMDIVVVGPDCPY